MNGPDIVAPTRDQKLAPMSCELITRDNPQLSRPINAMTEVSHFRAINCTEVLSPEIVSYIRDIAVNTDVLTIGPQPVRGGDRALAGSLRRPWRDALGLFSGQSDD